VPPIGDALNAVVVLLRQIPMGLFKVIIGVVKTSIELDSVTVQTPLE
jgi:hypothetical protein